MNIEAIAKEYLTRIAIAPAELRLRASFEFVEQLNREERKQLAEMLFGHSPAEGQIRIERLRTIIAALIAQQAEDGADRGLRALQETGKGEEDA